MARIPVFKLNQKPSNALKTSALPQSQVVSTFDQPQRASVQLLGRRRFQETVGSRPAADILKAHRGNARLFRNCLYKKRPKARQKEVRFLPIIAMAIMLEVLDPLAVTHTERRRNRAAPSGIRADSRNCTATTLK